MRASYGLSRAQDAAAAVEEAIDSARAQLAQAGPIVGALIFWGADHDAAVIADRARALLGDVPHVGCSTDGEITNEGLTVDSICVMLIASDKIRARAAVVPSLSAGSFEAGAAAARELRSPSSRALILLPDGLTGNGSAIIRGAQEVLGPDFVIAGGTAGDRGRFVETWQLSNGQVYQDTLVALMLECDSGLEVGFGVMSGWQPLGITKTVTRAEANTVYTINDETALDVYSRFLGDKASQLPAIGVEYPFALVDEHGSVDTRGIRTGEDYILLRAPMSVDRQSGAVTFAAEIPQGSKIRMTRARSAEIIAASRVAASRAAAQLSGPPDAVMFFSCMARRIVLGRKTGQEIEAALTEFGNQVPMIGFYTYGEIANCGDQRRPAGSTTRPPRSWRFARSEVARGLPAGPDPSRAPGRRPVGRGAARPLALRRPHRRAPRGDARRGGQPGRH